MFIVGNGLDALHETVWRQIKIVIPLKKQFYGMREFAVADRDGHAITFAEPCEE